MYIPAASLFAGPKDWDMNIYFNCSSVEVGSREACGVPFSCCKRQPNELIKNKQCGYDVRKPDYVSPPLLGKKLSPFLPFPGRFLPKDSTSSPVESFKSVLRWRSTAPPCLFPSPIVCLPSVRN